MSYFPVIGGGTRTSWNFGQDRGSHNHQGVDISAPLGTGVIAPAQLKVLRTGYQQGGAGNYVVGQDLNTGYEYKFFHLQGLDVQAGQTLSAGDVLGRVGNTGRSSGPHLHFEVRDRGGNLLNPKSIISNSKVLSKGKEILGRANDAAKKAARTALCISNPPACAADKAMDALGLPSLSNPLGGDGCGINLVCHFKKWVDETQFFQRFGIAFLAIVIIGGGIMLLSRGVVTKQLSEIVK